MQQLIIVADDYGLSAAYDAGIAEAARAAAIDGVGAMVLRDPEPQPLLGSGMEVGLHLELPDRLLGPARAGEREREETRSELERQLERFGELFGRLPAYVDGHHHAHAAPGLAAAVARRCAGLGLPVRSIDERHRRLLRCLGVATPDRLLGRLRESEPALPPEVEALAGGTDAPVAGLSEWMVHPGRRDPATGSSYDAGREQDLELLLELAANPALREARTTHAALGAQAACEPAGRS